jgi:mannitol-1-/sugar-/sorbitol-6-phosphatase
MESMGCRGVIFDLDGVLVDSAACIERHWRRWSLRHRLDPMEVMQVAHGRRTAETVRLVAPHLDAEEEAREIGEREALDLDGVRTVPGARELLGALPPGAWGVVTSGTRAVASARLAHCALPLPPILISAEDVRRGKPHPEGYLSAAERLGLDPPDCIVVEDSPPGIDAGRAAGMRVIGVATTHALEEIAHADVRVHRLSEIVLTSAGLAGGTELRLSVPRGVGTV